MDYSFFIEYLKQKQYLTDLEKDILDTWNELQKNPIDCSAAQRQVLQNDAKYPEIFFAIKSMPTTVLRPIEQMTESDIRYNLENQLQHLRQRKGGRNMANKLELTWYGKDEPIRVEPRLLIENVALSNTAADPDTQNMLIHGDNLLALKALESKFAGQVKCIYIEIKTRYLIQNTAA